LRGLRFSLRFRLLAHLGEAPRLPAFINSMGGVWSYGASLAQPILAGGGLQSNLRLAESQERQAQLSYRQTIQKAFGDVSDALIDYQKYHEARLKQEEYVGDLQESVRLRTCAITGVSLHTWRSSISKGRFLRSNSRLRNPEASSTNRWCNSIGLWAGDGSGNNASILHHAARDEGYDPGSADARHPLASPLHGRHSGMASTHSRR
jgi:hypothetical protein